ncbi:N-acetylmuramic acid 6-phosphate etherase [Loigolactobacillus jiayinensis]|uniref:N-acetylmuramic acid 6-phosphate etherase n=1 Tax=Loigolactobacillus jiayinensis TaxID=2486016 RepID=A0ABW1RDF2_9LACO|nr:N-acetylmuramic acid 6-phosphate etherase [Loigolactobacillus jiayinensis]
MKLENLETEKVNRDSYNIDRISTYEMVKIINHEDHRVAEAIEKILPTLATVIDRISERYNKGGRLIYLGAGTSGRLGILDAAELVPTFGIDATRVVGLIAGGHSAMFQAVEGIEDSTVAAQKELKNLCLSSMDTVIAIAASGRTPYCLGGLSFANTMGSLTVALTCVAESEMGKLADYELNPIVGPETITGSTRMKAGTAQKMVLNTLSTGVMIRAGKIYHNLMIDVLPTNEKLTQRAQRIIVTTTGVSLATAQIALLQAKNEVPTAITMLKTGKNYTQVKELLKEKNGQISQVLADD